MNEFYGTCANIPCKCLREGFRGHCPNWQGIDFDPATATKQQILEFREKLEALNEKHGKDH